MSQALHDKLFDVICANPGIHQTKILNESVKRGEASKNTVIKYLKELEGDGKIRSHHNGKFVEYTAVKNVPTEELDKTLNHNLDKLEKFIHDVRQDAKKYPYDPKIRLNDFLDYFLEQLNDGVMNDICRRWYDRVSEIRRACEEIRGMADGKSDDPTFQARQDLKHVSIHISNQYGTMSYNFSQMYEKYHRIKRRNRKQAALINQQMECNEIEMHALESDLDNIRDRLIDVVRLGRTDVDLCKLANEMRTKHTKPRPRR